MANKSIRIVFRLNAGKRAGLGHLTRCIALSQAFVGERVKILFIVKTDDKLRIKNFLKIEAPFIVNLTFIKFNISISEEIKILVKECKSISSFLIIDHYDHNLDYQKALKLNKILWAQFDFKSDSLILANIIINANISALIKSYTNITDKNSILCVGPKFALIREKFKKKPIHKERNKILISMIALKFS